MKKALVVAGVLVLAIIGYLGWKFQPTMKPGQAVFVSEWKGTDLQVQVWQRKNSSIYEPFATGIFVHKLGLPWRVFCVDHQDMYAPKILFSEQVDGTLHVIRREEIGYIDLEAGTYTRSRDKAVFALSLLPTEPPGQWWLP